MKFSFKDFFSKCDQIRSFLQIWSHFLKKFLMENFVFYGVNIKASNIPTTNQMFPKIGNIISHCVSLAMMNPQRKRLIYEGQKQSPRRVL